jgi:Ca2+-binding EF-hand superfamily protein
MKKALIVFIAIFAAEFGTPAVAQPSPPPGSVSPDLAPITRDEALKRADSLFGQLDLNHDGIVTRDEALRATMQLRAERKATGVDVAPGIGGHTARFLERQFEGVESINQQEFEQAMLAHFDEMDLNHDGVLSTEERQQAKAAKKPRQ